MNPIKCLGIIPARYPSSRLPGKPLKDICGKPLLQRVWEQALKAKQLSKVVIATDDDRIFDSAKNFGAQVLMTSSRHETGTDRVAEVARTFKQQGQSFDLIANVQGDMPFINPDIIDSTILTLAQASKDFGMSTVAIPILTEEEFLRPSAVKVVIAADGGAIYFSRAPVPFWRERSTATFSENEPCGYKHLGLYVFRPQVLETITTLPQSIPEKREHLEQLRALVGGIKIKVFIGALSMVQHQIEVDTPEDLERAVRLSGAKGDAA